MPTKPDIQNPLQLKWQSCIWLISLLPLVQAGLTWDTDGALSLPNYLIRHLSIPALMGEFAIIWLAVKTGMRVSAIFFSFNRLTKILMIIWICLGILSSSLTQGNIASSMLMMLRYLLHAVFFAAVIHIIPHNRYFSVSSWLRVISIGAAIYIVILSLFVVLVPDPSSFPWALRIPSATNVRQIANVVAIMAAAPAAILLFDRASKQWPYIALYTSIVAFCSWSGSRTAMVAMAASLAGGAIFCRALPAMKGLAAAGISWMGGLTFASALPVPGPDFGLFRILERMEEPSNLSSGRIDLWQNTIKEIYAKPWTGHGSGSFRQNMADVYGTFVNHPHNFVLQFIYDWGIVGATCAIVLGSFVLWAIWKTARNDPLTGFAASCGILTLLAASAVEGALYHALPMVMAICLIAPTFAASRDRRLGN